MRPDDLPSSQRSHLVRAEGGYWAFMPPPLDPGLTLGLGGANQLSAADRAIGELSGAGRAMPNLHLLSQTLLRREAVLSSRIEGPRRPCQICCCTRHSPAGPRNAATCDFASHRPTRRHATRSSAQHRQVGGGRDPHRSDRTGTIQDIRGARRRRRCRGCAGGA